MMDDERADLTRILQLQQEMLTEMTMLRDDIGMLTATVRRVEETLNELLAEVRALRDAAR